MTEGARASVNPAAKLLGMLLYVLLLLLVLLVITGEVTGIVLLMRVLH